MDAELSQITRGWSNVRREWFRIARQHIFESPEAAAQINQDGRAEAAMKACQLADAILYIGSNSYVIEPLLPRLFEKLIVMLSDSEQQNADIFGYFNRYKAAVGDHGEFLRFASDIAAHCLGDEFTAEAVSLTAFIPLFLAHSRWVVSKAFNDKSQMKKIEDWLELDEA
jgi:hypothetical protein